MIYWADNLYLLTPEEFEQLPAGVDMVSINGEKATKGKDYIDLDTRFVYLAYGINDPWNHKLKDLFLIFKLKQ